MVGAGASNSSRSYQRSPPGHLADRLPPVDRGRVDDVGRAESSLALLTVSVLRLPIEMMYGCLLAIAVARAFHQPAKIGHALPQLVPRELFSSRRQLGHDRLSAFVGPRTSAGRIPARLDRLSHRLGRGCNRLARRSGNDLSVDRGGHIDVRRDHAHRFASLPRPEPSGGASLRKRWSPVSHSSGNIRSFCRP